jgi:hypothetical protein
MVSSLNRLITAALRGRASARGGGRSLAELDGRSSAFIVVPNFAASAEQAEELELRQLALLRRLSSLSITP